MRLAALALCGLSLWAKSVPQADRIVIEKSAHKMTLFGGGKVLKTYLVALGSQSAGAKQRQGDHKTPEGEYVIDSKNPKSRFHLGLHVSYPNAKDRVRARKLRVDPGGAIMIHGLGANSHGSGRNIAEGTAPTAASRLRTRRSRRFGSRFRLARKWRSGRSAKACGQWP